VSDGGLTLTSDAPFKHVLLVRPTPQGHLGRHLEHTTELCCFEAVAASKVKFEDAEPRMVGEILGKGTYQEHPDYSMRLLRTFYGRRAGNGTRSAAPSRSFTCSLHISQGVLVKSRGAKSQNSISATYQGVLVVRVWGRWTLGRVVRGNALNHSHRHAHLRKSCKRGMCRSQASPLAGIAFRMLPRAHLSSSVRGIFSPCPRQQPTRSQSAAAPRVTSLI
jgi:hypothetical protein